MTRIYFIRLINVPHGPIKIGCSHRPEGRRRSLETWAPYPLEIVAQIEGGFQLERRFHALFADQHTHREWFAWSQELEDVIAAVRAETFDVETLPPPKKITAGGSKLGHKWTDQEKARVRRSNAMRRTEKASGLYCDYPHTGERMEAFIADPLTHGVSLIQRQQGVALRSAKQQQQRIDAQLRNVGLDPVVVALRPIEALPENPGRIWDAPSQERTVGKQAA